MQRSLLGLVLVCVCVPSVFAQAPYLVKDLGNAGSTSGVSSDPKAFLWSGNTLFFTATTEANGGEPWVRDGNGTRLLRDINGGPASSNVLAFVELTPGVVIFAADDGVTGLQLWRSDGTEAGTTLLKVVNATASLFVPALSYGGKVFFVADDGVHGREPWVTDGTAAGTQLLVDTIPGTAGIPSSSFFRFGNTTRILAGPGIWTTDGTPGGTTLNIPLASYRSGVAVTADAFYFFGFDSVHGFEPWKSDGTAAGTAMIKELRAGTTSYSTTIFSTASGAVFFADDGSGGGGRLWTTDGTAANTLPLAAFPATGIGNYTNVLYRTSQGLFFSFGSDVWRTDGTEGGTYIAATMSGGPSFGFTDAFSRIYFMSWTPTELHLFQFDGSRGATPVSVRPDIRVSDATFAGGKLWFAGRDAATGSELWVSDDGTTAGTHLAANLAPDPARSSTPVNLKAAGPYLYFHPAVPQELWRSDGTTGGTFEVTDVDNNTSLPAPFGDLTPYRGDLYYHHSHFELFRVDGVHGGATKIGDYHFDTMTADDSFIYLWEYGWGHVMRSDGTAAGTFDLYDPSDPSHLRGNYDYLTVLPYGGYAWIRCYHGIFRSAGTLATTQRLLALPESSFFSGDFAAAGGLLYSVIYTNANGAELWRTDGTGVGSGIVKDINPGNASSSPSSLTAAGRLLFFTATDAEHGTELWRSDGTPAGTFLVKDIRPGAASSGPSAIAALGDVVYFAANDGTNGTELWKSDGTEAGTVLVRDIAPGLFSSRPAWLAVAGGKVWFSANDGLHGIELWSSDGTELGTVMVSDIGPGSSSSGPDQLTAAESNLFFTATTDAEGRELWAMPLTGGYVTATGGRTTEGNSGTRALQFTITRRGVSSGPASVAYSTVPGTASPGSDYDPVSGTISFASGETVKTVSVTIHGDTDSEPNETLFLTLSSPAGAALQDVTVPGVIDDDDPLADLAADIVQSAWSSEAPRTVKVTNNGPSSVRNVTVTFTESPYEFPVYPPAYGDIKCTSTAVPTQCTIPFLQAGQSLTFDLQRWPVSGLVDPAMPPGRTVTVSVASGAADSDPSNNTASRMTTGDGVLMLPSKLVAGVSATATFDLGANASAPTDVTLTSSAGNVVVTPATARIETGQRTATFTLLAGAGADRTLLTATIGGQMKAALVAPIVPSAGQSPLLDVAIVANSKASLAYGELFVIPVRIAARYPDGRAPAGLVTLLDENGSTLAQLALDTAGAATFTRQQPAPGQYNYRIRYSGDGWFNPLTVPLPTITIQKALATVAIHGPSLTCSNTVELRVVVNGPEGSPVPTGTVSLAESGALGTYTLAPNGTPGQSEFTVTLNFANGYRFVNASYSGDATFAASGGRRDFTVGCSAMNFVATATSPTSVALSWTQPAPTTNHYEVYRADSVEGLFRWVASSSGYTAVDTTALPDRVYLYFVVAYGAIFSPTYNSGMEVASTFVHADAPLAAGTLIKSIHLAQLRAMVGALRTAAGLPALTFSGSVAPGSVVDARHITELRSSIDASRARIGLPAINWTQPNAAAGSLIRAATVQELRGAAD
jgi:ELWxxDGT repeat protein